MRIATSFVVIGIIIVGLWQGIEHLNRTVEITLTHPDMNERELAQTSANCRLKGIEVASNVDGPGMHGDISRRHVQERYWITCLEAAGVQILKKE